MFSSMHESGQRKLRRPKARSSAHIFATELNQLTGIAAILTFPLDIEVVEAEEREAKEEQEQKRREEAGEEQPAQS